MRYGYFDSEIIGTDPEGMPIFDRAETSDLFRLLFAKLVSNGVLADPGDCFQVVAAEGLNVTVRPGFGMINGAFAYDEAENALTLEKAPARYSRIDRIVLRCNYADRLCDLVVKTGTVANNPVAPEIVQPAAGDYYELGLATVAVGANVTVITQANITDTRGDSTVCGFITQLIDHLDTSVFFAQLDQLGLEFKQESRKVIKAIVDELSRIQSGSGVELAKLQFVDTVIPKSAFVADATYPDYPYRAAVALEGVLESMIPQVALSVEDAISGNFAPAAQSYNGGVYIYAASPPDGAITIPTMIFWRGNA